MVLNEIIVAQVVILQQYKYPNNNTPIKKNNDICIHSYETQNLSTNTSDSFSINWSKNK